jgi:phosphoglycolate phosphatase
MINKDILVFDFDGTLVQSMQVVFEILNKLAGKEGFRSVNENDIERFRIKGSREVIINLSIPFYRLPRIVGMARKILEAEMESIKPVEGMAEV